MGYSELLEKNWDKISKLSQAFGFVQGMISGTPQGKWTDEFRENFNEYLNDIWTQIQDEEVKTIDFSINLKSKNV
jgi:hypothetical protein